MRDYNKNPLRIGDYIRNIESGWAGKITDTTTHNGGLFLVCKGVNWWTGELDEDNVEWHSAADVVKVELKDIPLKTPVNPTNFL